MSLPWAEFLSFWSNWVLVGTLVVGVIATAFVVITGNIKETALKRELAAATGAAATANNAAASANERAAILEKEAAEEKLRAAEIMKATAWRQFQPEQIAKLTDWFSKFHSKLVLAWIANDSESLSLAVQFSDILAKAHWDVSVSARTYSTRLMWGVWIPSNPAAPETVRFLRRSFDAIGVPYSTDSLPTPDMSFGASNLPTDSAIILFGSKKPRFAQPPN